MVEFPEIALLYRARFYFDNVVGGDSRNLLRLFLWEDTFQGHEYWEARYHGPRLLTREDLQYILATLRSNGVEVDAESFVNKAQETRLW